MFGKNEAGQVSAWSSGEARKLSVSVLAVGGPAEWTRQGSLPPTDAIAFVAYGDLSEAVLAAYAPQVIVSPTLAASFDCIELAILLQTLCYSGAYRAIAKDVPYPEIIEREVSQMCPTLDFRIVKPT